MNNPSTFLGQLAWRDATKVFDPEKKVSEALLQQILHAIEMAPTSLGLQAFGVRIITDTKTKEALFPVSKNQKQITTCSHLLVFCADTDKEGHIQSYFEAYKALGAISEEKIEARKALLNSYLKDLTPEEYLAWAQNQVYLVLGFALAACAELKVDSCPMGGFEPEGYARILKLPAHLVPTIVLPIGYRAEEPRYPKVRVPQEKIIKTM